MKVLHVVKTSNGARWALRQVRELCRQGIIVHVAAPHGRWRSEYEVAGAVVHPFQFDFPSTAPWLFPERSRHLRRLVDQIKPDLIHSHHVGTTITARLALGRNHTIPRLFQVPGPLHLEHPSYRRIELATAGPGDFWTATCQSTYDLYREAGVSEGSLFLSYHGTDIVDFMPRPTGGLRAELGLSSSLRIVGMVAYFYAPKWYLGQRRGIKGHEDLIDALGICRDNRLPVVGVFVGGARSNASRYERRVVAYAARRCEDAVIFLGSRDDVADLYSDFDVAVHPSLSENVGGAVESLLMGVPTIATSVGGLPDLVERGETGWLVPPKDPTAIAEAIEDALTNADSSRLMARRGQARAREMFDVRKKAVEIVAIYEQILRHGRRRTSDCTESRRRSLD
jgi:glycosyltransferase involved in cell wall biosynthesis